jgi:uncharacterized protein (TIGR02147 family)
MALPLYKQIMHQELARRSERNPHYSLRAFSRSMSVDVGVLSRVLANKRTLSFPVADRIVKALSLSPEERGYFLNSVADEQKNRKLSTPIQKTEAQFVEVESDYFHIIGDWYHYAILELTDTLGFKNDPKWIAKQFGLNVLEVKLALEKLKKVGLLKEESGKLKRNSTQITTKNKELTNSALKKHQKQMLQRACDSMDEFPITERDMTGMTMAIDPAKLPMAKGMIQDFSKELAAFLESGKKKQVYQLQLSLFPLQKKDKGN